MRASNLVKKVFLAASVMVTMLFSSLTLAATAKCETKPFGTMASTHVSTATQTTVERTTYNFYFAEWDVEITAPTPLSGGNIDQGIPSTKPLVQAWSLSTNVPSTARMSLFVDLTIYTPFPGSSNNMGDSCPLSTVWP
jgi:hypothetical protein